MGLCRTKTPATPHCRISLPQLVQAPKWGAQVYHPLMDFRWGTCPKHWCSALSRSELPQEPRNNQEREQSMDSGTLPTPMVGCPAVHHSTPTRALSREGTSPRNRTWILLPGRSLLQAATLCQGPLLLLAPLPGQAGAPRGGTPEASGGGELALPQARPLLATPCPHPPDTPSSYQVQLCFQ